MVIIFKQLYLWKGKEKVTEIVGKHEETPKKKKKNKLGLSCAKLRIA